MTEPPGRCKDPGRATARTGRPHRSSWTPTALRGLLEGHGLTVTADEDLLTVAERLAVPAERRASLGRARIATATT